MASEKSHIFFKDPHKDTQNIGSLPITIHYKTSKKYPSTCSALSDLAEVSTKDDISKRNGNDNYRASLERLLNCLDTFIKEKSENKSSAGVIINYDRSSNCHFTIMLLWQIRNVLTHKGGVIDESCKKNYESVFLTWKINSPIIDLPPFLTIGEKFYIQFEDYEKIFKCIFEYFKENVSEEDLIIFNLRATISNVKIQNADILLKTSKGTIFLDIVQAMAHGFEINPETREIIPPEGSYYAIEEERIYFKNGESFPAKLDKTNTLKS